MEVIITIYCDKIERVNCYSCEQDAEDHYYEFVEENYKKEMLEEGVPDDYMSIMKHAEQHMVERVSRIEWWRTDSGNSCIRIDPIEWDSGSDS